MENELLGPSIGQDRGRAPTWWKRGVTVKRIRDGQEAVAEFGQDGAPLVLLQRGVAGTFRQPANPAEWELAGALEPLTTMQVARVCYEADRALRTALGEPGIKEWTGILEQERIRWLAVATGLRTKLVDGPNADLRAELLVSIVEALT